jgi:hypothetical protein
MVQEFRRLRRYRQRQLCARSPTYSPSRGMKSWSRPAAGSPGSGGAFHTPTRRDDFPQADPKNPRLQRNAAGHDPGSA